MVGAAQAFAEAQAHFKAAKSLKFLKWIGDVPEFSLYDGSAIPAEVVKGWLAEAIKAEAPDGDDRFERVLDLMEPDETARFSLWVLDTWIAFDTAYKTDAEAEKKAIRDLTSGSVLRRFGQPMLDDLRHLPEFEAIKTRHMRKYANSGWSSRCVLALAARAPGRSAALSVRTFIEKHARRHGTRSAQGKLAMALLARIGDQHCLEVLSTVAAGRNEGLAATAIELLEAIRLKRGWSPQELTDRAVSSAGLDDRMGFDLPWGETCYRVQVDDALETILLNPAGKTVKSLPTPKTAAQKETKKALGDIKKNIAATIKTQTDRLYGEMCMGRIWQPDDWRTFILDHPILGRIAQRLVWYADMAGEPVSIRPTAEGDVIGVKDKTLDLTRATGIQLAHRIGLGTETSRAWLEHFEDYEITALFDQFTRVHPGDEAMARFMSLDAVKEAAPIDNSDSAWRWKMQQAKIWGPDLLSTARRLGYAPPGTGKTFWQFPDLTKVIANAKVLLSVYGPPPSEPAHVYVNHVASSLRPEDLPPILASEILNDLRELLGHDPFPETTS